MRYAATNALFRKGRTVTNFMHSAQKRMLYAELSKSVALFLESVHYCLNWAEKGVLSVLTTAQLFTRS